MKFTSKVLTLTVSTSTEDIALTDTLPFASNFTGRRQNYLLKTYRVPLAMWHSLGYFFISVPSETE